MSLEQALGVAFSINSKQRLVLYGGENAIRLGRQEFEVFRHIAEQRGRTVTHQRLYDIMDPEASVSDAETQLRTVIFHIRNKLKRADMPVCIMTNLGFGYAFCGTFKGDDRRIQLSEDTARLVMRFLEKHDDDEFSETVRQAVFG